MLLLALGLVQDIDKLEDLGANELVIGIKVYYNVCVLAVIGDHVVLVAQGVSSAVVGDEGGPAVEGGMMLLHVVAQMCGCVVLR